MQKIIMKYFIIFSLLLAFNLSNKVNADEPFSPHTMGHIVGGIGSFFLGPLPGLGLSIIPEALALMDNHNPAESNDKIVFKVNKYSQEYDIQPYVEESKSNRITRKINTVKLTNSLSYY